MTDIEITHTASDTKGKFMAVQGDKQIGEMSYSRAGSTKIIIDHTEVDSAAGGKGVGKQLLAEAVNFARTNSFKILPLCPFARKMFDRDPTIADVLF